MLNRHDDDSIITEQRSLSDNRTAYHYHYHYHRTGPARHFILNLASLATRALSQPASDVESHVQKILDYLTTSRPTAVNLMDAAKKLKALAAAASTDEQGATGHSVCKAVIEACEEMLVQDVKDNRAIGAHGADFLAQKAFARYSVCVCVSVVT